MKPYWIGANGLQLAIVPCPRGWDWLSDDINALRTAGIDVLVSALTWAEIDEFGLSSEPDFCRSTRMEFLNFPIDDRSVPSSLASFNEILNKLATFLTKGKSVAIHCRAGIGRSSLIAACLLVHTGLSTEQALVAIRHARGCSVPDTEEQKEWIQRFEATQRGKS